MAILIYGESCPLCGLPIDKCNRSVSFPPFVGNELDPLFAFSDSAFHEDCFRRHPLAESATAVVDDMQAKLLPINRNCTVCETPITDPDEYCSLGLLTSDKASPLWTYNFTQFHRTCLASWPQSALVRGLLQDMASSGKWRGKALQWLLKRLDRGVAERPKLGPF